MRVPLPILALLLAAGCGATEKAPQPPSIEELTTMLKSEDPKAQRDAAHWVVQLGPQGAATAPALLHALTSHDMTVRQSAAMALGKIGPEIAAQAVPVLTAALADPEPAVQQSAAEALGSMGPAASSAIPALERLQSESPSRCRAAPAALQKIKS